MLSHLIQTSYCVITEKVFSVNKLQIQLSPPYVTIFSSWSLVEAMRSFKSHSLLIAALCRYYVYYQQQLKRKFLGLVSFEHFEHECSLGQPPFHSKTQDCWRNSFVIPVKFLSIPFKDFLHYSCIALLFFDFQNLMLAYHMHLFFQVFLLFPFCNCTREYVLWNLFSQVYTEYLNIYDNQEWSFMVWPLSRINYCVILCTWWHF